MSIFQVEDMLDSFYKELVPSVQNLDTPYPSRAKKRPDYPYRPESGRSGTGQSDQAYKAGQLSKDPRKIPNYTVFNTSTLHKYDEVISSMSADFCHTNFLP